LLRLARFCQAVLLAVLVVACVDPEVTQRQPVSTADGLQMTGQLDSHRLAVSDGEPEVVHADCDAPDGVDEDLCIVARTIDGATLSLVIENPALLVAGESLVVSSCQGHCDDHDAGVVIEVRLDGSVRRASGGTLDVISAGPRWAAAFRVTFGAGDQLAGSFDVQPLG
jgi:hypothetical protein